jgi:drug/metabolite transporter (DMT)-like permease
MISVIANLGPPITVVMAFFWLGETVNNFEGVLMFLQLCCAMVVVFGNPNAGSGSLTDNKYME